MKHRLSTAAVGVALVCMTWVAEAQMPGAGGGGAMNATLTKLFGQTKAFSSKADVRVLDADQKEMVSMPMDFALLDESVRIGMDMSLMKNSSMPPGTMEQLKQMGMDQVVSLIRPDKKMVYVSYTRAKVVLALPMTQAEVDSAQKMPKIEKTELGKETVDGHSCIKNKVILTPDAGEKLEATTWNASDLKDFPVQIQTKEQANTSIIVFKQIQLAKPDAKMFDPPAGYTEYKSQQELMQAILKKTMDAKK